MTRAPHLLLSLALLGSLLGGVLRGDEGKGGLPAPDPRAKARLSVRWKAPQSWAALQPRQGEFAAYRLRRTVQQGEREVREEGPRLVIYYLGKKRARLELPARRAGWARRFLSPKRERLPAEAAKVRALATKAKDPGLAIHLVEVRGDYSAVLAPGQEPRPPQRDWTGLYAHVVAPDGVWCAVLLGPSAELEPWRAELEGFLGACTSGTVLVEPDPRERRPAEAPQPSATPPATPPGVERGEGPEPREAGGR